MIHHGLSRRSGLLRHSLDDHSVVYDQTNDRIHLLDPTTSHILDRIENGVSDAATLTEEIQRATPDSDSQALVQLALEELEKADLLEVADSPPPEPAASHPTDVTRRDLLRRVAVSGLSALLVPAIVTLTADTAYAQDSCGQCNGNCIVSPCCAGFICVSVNALKVCLLPVTLNCL